MKQNYTLQDLPQVAAAVVEQAKHKVLLFYGAMGVGKTTLIKEVVKQLDVTDTVSSPTFSLINEYRSSSGFPVFHFDFYRIDDEVEAMDIGVEEYFDSGNWCLIEWPEKIENLLPLMTVSITITVDADQKRTIQLTNHE